LYLVCISMRILVAVAAFDLVIPTKLAPQLGI
jgi:hypothetical protein